MSVVSDTNRTFREGVRSLPATVVALILLLSLLTIGAIQGGVAMVTNPTNPLGMSTSYLEGTPVADYFWPGVFLLGISAASIITVAGLVSGWEWRWAHHIEFAVGYRWPWIGAVSTGSVLLLFEVIELFVVPFHPIMHPLLIAASMAIVGLALTRSARAHLSVAATTDQHDGWSRTAGE